MAPACLPPCAAAIPASIFTASAATAWRDAGCRIHYPLTELAGVGFVRVLSSIPRVPGILKLADRLFRETRPDALVLIDFPAFHWWLAKCAKKHGIPVVWFVPPQLWAWASWRVKWMRRLADHVLCTLPFEEEWYRQRGVESHYIGHPYFDELHEPTSWTTISRRPARQAGNHYRVVARLAAPGVKAQLRPHHRGGAHPSRSPAGCAFPRRLSTAGTRPQR